MHTLDHAQGHTYRISENHDDALVGAILGPKAHRMDLLNRRFKDVTVTVCACVYIFFTCAHTKNLLRT